MIHTKHEKKHLQATCSTLCNCNYIDVYTQVNTYIHVHAAKRACPYRCSRTLVIGYQIHCTLTSTDRHHQVVMQTEIGSIIIALCDNLYTVVRLLLFHVVYINTTVTRGSPYRKTTIIYVLVYGNKPTDCCIFRRDLQHSWVAITNQRWLKLKQR